MIRPLFLVLFLVLGLKRIEDEDENEEEDEVTLVNENCCANGDSRSSRETLSLGLIQLFSGRGRTSSPL